MKTCIKRRSRVEILQTVADAARELMKAWESPRILATKLSQKGLELKEALIELDKCH